MLGTHQPVTQHFEKPGRANFSGRIQILGKRSHGAFIDFEEQSILAAEVLEDGPFGNAEAYGDVPDASGVIPMLGKMMSSGLNDSGPFCLRAGAGLALPLIERRRNAIAGNSWHNDYRSRKHTAGTARFQLHFCFSLR